MTFKDELEENIEGEVHFEEIWRKIYSVDASIFEVEPIGIVIPKHKEDIVKAVQIAVKHQIPIIPRGAATGITGGCIGRGLIIDTSKYFNKILKIDYDEEYAIVEPGVVQDTLNSALSIRGYCLGPETSTGNRATIGGMVANNAAGSRSLLYGKMVDHVESVEMVLSSGEVGNEIYNAMEEIKTKYGQTILEQFPQIPRRVSGYNLDELMKPGPLNLAKIITGSEGTLGVITEIKVKISKKPKFIGQCLIFYYDLNSAMESVPHLLKHHLIALEMIDDTILETGRKAPSMRGKLKWMTHQPKVLFVAEIEGGTEQEVRYKLNALEVFLKASNIGYAHLCLTDPEAMQQIRELRKSGLGLLLSKRSYNRAIAFMEDISIPPDRLAAFFRKFTSYLQLQGTTAGIYGHVGSGCMHIRPYLNLLKPDDLKLMQQMLEFVSSLVLEQGGAMSGEHGDGMIRSFLNEKMFGPAIYQAFLDVKEAFDPLNLMNPGKVVNGKLDLEHLRLKPKMPISQIKTFQNFEREGGFELSVDLCNGNGLCRKKDKIMCPSFQATQSEFDTTRARAQSLRDLIHQEKADLTNPDVHQVLDLCLSCKGCKTECPSQVDMAKLKAEFLYHYQEKYGYSYRDTLFAHVGNLTWWNSFFPKLYNSLSKTSFAKAFLDRIGIGRELPLLSPHTFSHWARTYKQPLLDKEVVLFSDTFTEFHQPEIGKAALRILNGLGYNVVVPKWRCCGRPMISKGFLKEAKKQALTTIHSLQHYTDLPIIGLEPSCILTMRDDYPNITDYPPMLYQTFDEFLQNEILFGELPLAWKEEKQKVKVHGHCHQKALVGMKPTFDVLKSIPGVQFEEIPSGCCGMAGSFGYEKEHIALSKQIGELVLLPEVRKAEETTLILASGFSCRSQIALETDRRALHLAEIIERMQK